MLKKYKHIFFDLDDTLWDFYANANEALSFLFEKYRLKDHYVESQQLIDTFHAVNNQLWVLYRNNEIDRDYLREKRFNLIFEKLENKSFTAHADFAKEYLSLCPTRENLVDGAGETLDYLVKKYELHVITNGFDEVARTKLECSGLGKYFDQIITSEDAGSKKPAHGIFDYALKAAKAEKSHSLMIGNDLEADIYGAMSAGIDQVYYNPAKAIAEKKPTYEIMHLAELQKLL